MSSTWGRRIRLTIFGESHGDAIGIVIDGLPPGIQLDHAAIAREMERRAPGQNELSTPREEGDKPVIVSGIFNGYTTGAPLCAIIQNQNTVSSDYNPTVVRPGHADLTAHYKFGGFADYRGGGHFSGRLTAPLVFAGAIAKQVLSMRGIEVAARIAEIGGIKDVSLQPEDISALSAKSLPVFDDMAAQSMRTAIIEAKRDGDSLGGIIECAAIGVPIGLGSPFFESIESAVASMMFSIPAVKGVEFGLGFDSARMRGSEVNDCMCVENGKIHLLTNNNGGINGGISNGAPIVVRVAVKPTPTIQKGQLTVDTETMRDTVLQGKGRHDPCIVPRAVPVVEAGLALCILDCFE